MANLFKSLLGICWVEQKGDTIRLGGIAAQSLARDIQSTWGTSKINNHMFTDFGKRSLEFPLFYALEVHYMLQRLLKNRRNWTSRNTILAAIKQLEENTWLANLHPDKEPPKILDRSKLSLFHKTPLDYQQKFFDTYENGRGRLGLNGYLLSVAPGGGKTLLDLMIAEMVGSDYVIVLAPNNAVQRVWRKAIAGLNGEGCEFKKPQSVWIAGEGLPYKREKYLVAHHEGKGPDTLLSVIRNLHGKITVILDESHNFNEMKSNRTNLFIELCATVKSENILWASGTPIKALGGESIPLLKTIDPLFTPKVEASFKQIFGINAQRALDILRNRMGFVTYTVDKNTVQASSDSEKPLEKELKVQIPNGSEYTLDSIRQKMMEFTAERTEYYKKNFQTYEDIYQDGLRKFEASGLSSEVKTLFAQYKRDVKIVKERPDPRFTAKEMAFCNSFEVKHIMPALSLEERKAFKGAKAVFKYVHLKILGECLGGVLGKARSRLHVEMLDHIDFEQVMSEAEKKTVVFTSYVEVVKRADEMFKSKGMHPLMVYAETNKNLTANISAFDKDPNVNPLVATFNSLSTAVPLVMADLSIFLNVPFRDHELVQAKARTDRLGQDTRVKYLMVYLDTGKEPNISTRSKEILEWSREQIQAIMGADYNGEVAKTMDGYIASLESGEFNEDVLSFESALNDILDEPLE